jgi:hypothetical protein
MTSHRLGSSISIWLRVRVLFDILRLILLSLGCFSPESIFFFSLENLVIPFRMI